MNYYSWLRLPIVATVGVTHTRTLHGRQGKQTIIGWVTIVGLFTWAVLARQTDDLPQCVRILCVTLRWTWPSRHDETYMTKIKNGRLLLPESHEKTRNSDCVVLHWGLEARVWRCWSVSGPATDLPWPDLISSQGWHLQCQPRTGCPLASVHRSSVSKTIRMTYGISVRTVLRPAGSQ